jgi:hypothetical protein
MGDQGENVLVASGVSKRSYQIFIVLMRHELATVNTLE